MSKLKQLQTALVTYLSQTTPVELGKDPALSGFRATVHVIDSKTLSIQLLDPSDHEISVIVGKDVKVRAAAWSDGPDIEDYKRLVLWTQSTVQIVPVLLEGLNQ